MPVEEQLENSADDPIYEAAIPGPRYGQKLTIPNRKVTKLSFLMRKSGSPAGNLFFSIYKVSDDSLIVEKLWGTLQTVPGSDTWLEAVLDTPTVVDEEVRICARVTAGTSSHHVRIRYQNADVKASELQSRWQTSSWNDIVSRDTAYKYTYSIGWAGGNVGGVAIGAIAKINGVALADIAKVNGVS